jgi:hypothetical protein
MIRAAPERAWLTRCFTFPGLLAPTHDSAFHNILRAEDLISVQT